MAESTCVMHPFSYTTPAFSDETHEENKPMACIGESVSFGRYMSDSSLEWEKWSSFSSNRNRHVEEASKYSKPGSVAQKKAYFEAHFKRMAALKAAAALLEQANATENTSEGQTVGQPIGSAGQDVKNVNSNVQIEANVNHHGVGEDEIVGEAKKFDVQGEDKDVGGFVVHQNELYTVSAEDEVSVNDGKGVDPTLQNESSNHNEHKSADLVHDINRNRSSVDHSSGETFIHKPPLQKKKASFDEEASASIVKKNPPLSSYMSPGTGRTSLLAESTGSIYPGKENYATPIKKKLSFNDPEKKKTPLRMSINREFNRILSPVIRKIGTSSKASKDCYTPSKTPAMAAGSGTSESPYMTPSRGTRSSLDSPAGGSKPRWHVFLTDAAMSPGNSRYRISSPIIPSSFCLSGDRAARRKQKLEDKFNASATERPPQPSKFKEKAEAELNKFRQSFCFKAMPSPEHTKENEILISPKQKVKSRQGKSPKRGKQPHESMSHSKTSLPPRRSTVKQSGSRK